MICSYISINKLVSMKIIWPCPLISWPDFESFAKFWVNVLPCRFQHVLYTIEITYKQDICLCQQLIFFLHYWYLPLIFFLHPVLSKYNAYAFVLSFVLGNTCIRSRDIKRKTSQFTTGRHYTKMWSCYKPWQTWC